MEKLKIAYIVGGLPFGGVERSLYDLNLELIRSGSARGRVFNLSGSGILQPEFHKAGIEVEAIGKSTRALATYRMDTVLKLRGKLLAFSPDVIHTMHFTANHLGRLAAIGLGIPVITHLHNTKREKKLVRRISDKFLSHVTDLYLAVSKAVAETVALDHNRAGRQCLVLYNAIDPANFRNEPLDLRSEFGLQAPVIIAVGRYVPQKNFDKLILALSLLHKQGIRASLALVGEGPERSSLEKLANSLELDEYVALTGFRRDVDAFYKAGAVFALPSEYEGFPIAQLEAMYCGLPCVISDKVPAKEIAEDTALICSTEAADIAEKIRLTLCDEPLRSRMAAKARRIAENFTMDKYARRLCGIYADLVRRSRQIKNARTRF
jgi:glycosyltransferase involved in cell wall biosynthesis